MIFLHFFRILLEFYSNDKQLRVQLGLGSESELHSDFPSTWTGLGLHSDSKCTLSCTQIFPQLGLDLDWTQTSLGLHSDSEFIQTGLGLDSDSTRTGGGV
jgi:hypothetical protein